MVNLVKWMPEITAEERQCLFTKFIAAGEKCDQVQEPETCFRPEVVICYFPLKFRKDEQSKIPYGIFLFSAKS